MFTLDRTDAQRIAVSAMGALVLSATCVFGAVAPARAAAPQTAPAWAAQVQDRVANVRMDDARFAPRTIRTADVALRFAADGSFAGASLARSSGSAMLDAQAVKVASRLAYPPMPAAMRGAARTVRLQLAFGDGASGAVPPIERRVEVAQARPRDIQVAAR